MSDMKNDPEAGLRRLTQWEAHNVDPRWTEWRSVSSDSDDESIYSEDLDEPFFDLPPGWDWRYPIDRADKRMVYV